MGDGPERTLDDIGKVLTLAKLTEDEVIPKSQVVFFADNNFYDNNYTFMELDDAVMKEIKEGQTVYIKGDDDENVVLCTKNRTYDVVGAETSNSMLLTRNMQFFNDIKDETERSFSTVTVSGIFYDYLSLSISKPHLKKLTEVLNKSLYKGPEHEYEVQEGDLRSYEDLNRTVQASEEELSKALSAMNVITIDNKVRLLDFQYHFRVLSYMLKLIDENSWALDEIDYEETINALKDVIPEDIISGLFDKYTEESKIIDGLQLYSYKEAKVCKFFAEVLLFGAGKFNLQEFLQAWSESVPEGMRTDEELLHGIAIIDRTTRPNVISAFPEDQLPEEVNARFNILFKMKAKWSVAEIAPYIQSVTTDRLDVNALLAKHARASHVDGVKCYSAKHAK